MSFKALIGNVELAPTHKSEGATEATTTFQSLNR